MGTFSSGTGLISGFDIEGYVSQIMAIEGANRDKYKARIEDNTEEAEAVQELQNLVKAVQLQAANFNTFTVFENKTASSSNEDAMTATTKKWAQTGTYQFVVKSLASNHQFVTRNSYTNRTSSVGSGTISFEVGQGQLNRDIELNTLNGRTGIQRGKFQITNKAGNTAVIDLTTALSVNDVIKTINSSGIGVTASVSRDGLVLTDNTSGTGNFTVSEYGDGQTAADLGILQSTSESRIFGQDIINLSGYTLLSELNDGNGVRDLSTGITIASTDGSVPDAVINFSKSIDGDGYTIGALNSGSGVRLGKFNITDRNGMQVTVDVSEMDSNSTTIDQLINEINRQASEGGLDLTFSYEGKSGITITDNSEAFSSTDDDERKGKFTIEDIEGGNTASDLGIDYSTTSSTISGTNIWKMETLSDAMAAINYSVSANLYGNNIYTASINASGNGLTINSQAAGGFTVTSNNGLAAEDLGIATSGTAVEGVLNGKAII
ncbi:MAG: hypothetical protein JXM68_02610, partial [Sedimentisphaerales bacterium]|nr:hypothetical protein [Sedimentisphaerales bacterium]